MYNKNLTAIEIEENYNKLMVIVDMFKNDSRHEKIVELYEDLGEQIALSPASTFTKFHGCYPGGYVEHVLHVIKASLKLYKLWEEMGANMGGYTKEELVFSAMFHDLGKIGDKNVEYYICNESEWHRENQGKMYEINPKLKNIPHEERSLYLLQKYDIKINENEYIAIRAHSGPFSNENKPYWAPGFNKAKEFRNNMPIILHYADYLAYRIEMEQEGTINPIL